MSRVIHFEIHVDEPQRAIDFYTSIFNWKIEKWNSPQDYWLVSTGKGIGIDGALTKRERPSDGDSPVGYICTIDVESVNAVAGTVVRSGGSIVKPKMAIPGVGYIAYCRDTEGNIFGIRESDESAK